MQLNPKHLHVAFIHLLLCCSSFGQPTPAPAGTAAEASHYVLGPGDQITIWAVDLEEVSQKPLRVDNSGWLTLPLGGRLKASGLTLTELESDVTQHLRKYQRDPHVTVSITEYRSQPVSVLGAVNHPGVHHLQGPTTLAQTLSVAGGLRADAGYSIKITRTAESGDIPLPDAKKDPTGRFSIAEVSVSALIAADRPEQNILIKSQDIVSVPKAEMIYVLGEVIKPGAYTLGELQEMSVLKVLSLAGGLSRTASPKKARILRVEAGASKRVEKVLDLRKVLSGDAPDVPMNPEDILFVPDNKPKSVALRAAEAAVSVGTGVVVWRGSR